jgi:hypothetical protein
MLFILNLVKFVPAAYTVTESDGASVNFVIQLIRSSALSQVVTVELFTTNGSAEGIL